MVRMANHPTVDFTDCHVVRLRVCGASAASVAAAAGAPVTIAGALDDAAVDDDLASGCIRVAGNSPAVMDANVAPKHDDVAPNSTKDVEVATRQTHRSVNRGAGRHRAGAEVELFGRRHVQIAFLRPRTRETWL